eukprot:365551-Chlamydomonas_euryale.AAC.4
MHGRDARGRNPLPPPPPAIQPPLVPLSPFPSRNFPHTHAPRCGWQVSKKYKVALASTLNQDGSLSSDKYDAVSAGAAPCTTGSATAG